MTNATLRNAAPNAPTSEDFAKPAGRLAYYRAQAQHCHYAWLAMCEVCSQLTWSGNHQYSEPYAKVAESYRRQRDLYLSLCATASVEVRRAG